MLWQHTQHDVPLRNKVLAGLRRYQQATRSSAPARQEIGAAGRARLLRPGIPALRIPEGPPVVLISSLINPPDVMDISDERSLLRDLLRNGVNAMLLDWGSPAPDESALDLAGHVEQLLLPLLGTLDRPPILIGYCLGGTLALAAASVLQAAGSPPVAVATIAAPWRFSAYDDIFRSEGRRIWDNARPVCEQLGQVPMEVLQTGFWSLDPARTISKYATFADMDEASPAYSAFITLEDWANAGAPLTLAAGRDLVQRCYGADDPGKGAWSVGGAPVDPAALTCPTLAIASTRDSIVPAAASPPAKDRMDLALGHVGMMVGSLAEQSLFRPLTDWIVHHS